MASKGSRPGPAMEPSRDPILAGEIRRMEEFTSKLYSSINSHIKTPASKHQIELRALVAELRLLGGTLHSLHSLIQDLEEADETSKNSRSIRRKHKWQILDDCKRLLSALDENFTLAEPNELLEAKASVAECRAKFSFLIVRSESLQDISLHLSILGMDLLPEFASKNNKRDQPGAALDESIERLDGSPSVEEVSSWLLMLNLEEHNRAPAEHCWEKALVESRRMLTPEYRKAATQWPKYAEAHWSKLGPQICSLFRVDKSYNLIQWVLEYARETYPRVFGNYALSPTAVVGLTNALCDGSVSTLHIAAALGLPSLCKALLSMGAAINQCGALGSPLFCALVGPKVLVTRAEPESWMALLDNAYDPKTRAETVNLLIQNHADCKRRFRWKNLSDAANASESFSLSGLALWVSAVTKDDLLFELIVLNGAKIDESLVSMLQLSFVVEEGRKCGQKFAIFLTHVFDDALERAAKDRTLFMPPKVLDDEGDKKKKKKKRGFERVRDAMRRLMNLLDLEFVWGGTKSDPGALPYLSDKEFAELVRGSMRDNDPFFFRRLTFDPRFNHNSPFDPNLYDGSLLHYATEGNSFTIMDILIRHGADLSARDSHGRTPMMVAEKVGALKKLVKQYGASTMETDERGRTIWHLLAASNDDDLLEWLCRNDPQKEQCLHIRDNDGSTALDVAIRYPLESSMIPALDEPWIVVPHTARRLLYEHHKFPRTRRDDIFQDVVQYGEVDLLDSLLGVCFPPMGPGPECRSLIHSLNLAASEKLICRVMELCKDFPMHLACGNSPAETIFTNTKMYYGRRKRVKGNAADQPGCPTSHPSCSKVISKGAYEKLLTPEVLAYKDQKGRGIWERWCAAVVPMFNGGITDGKEFYEFLLQSMSVALSSLAAKGALSDYEEQTGCSALKPLQLLGPILPRTFKVWQSPVVPVVVSLMESDATAEFMRSRYSLPLVVAAIESRDPDFLMSLIIRGAPIMSDEFKLSSYLCNTHLKADLLVPLVGGCTVDELNELSDQIWAKLGSDFTGHGPAQSRLEFLMRSGLDVNHISERSQSKLPALVQAVTDHNHHLANFLLDNGADPALGLFGFNALMAAVEIGCEDLTSRTIEIFQENEAFDWSRYYDKPDGPTYSYVQLAITSGNSGCLEILLTNAKLSPDGTTPRNLWSPMHIAVQKKSLECLKYLVGAGGWTLWTGCRDEDGETPLELAHRLDFKDALDFFEEHGRGQVEGDEPSGPPPAPEPMDLRPEPRSIDPPAPISASRSMIMKRKRDRAKGDHLLQTYFPERNSQRVSVVPLATLLELNPSLAVDGATFYCRGCSPLSLATQTAKLSNTLALAKSGAGGYITGCLTHWKSGFNALTSPFGDVKRLVVITDPPCCKETLEYLKIYLDRFLADGVPWFHMSATPIHRICSFRPSERPLFIKIDAFAARALRVVLDHVKDHVEEYWELVQSNGISPPTADGTVDRFQRILSLALDARSRTHLFLTAEDRHNRRSTPLHLLIECRVDSTTFTTASAQILESLIAAGSDIDAQDHVLETPLHIAVKNGHMKFAQKLLAYGANPNIMNSDGSTPLNLAVANSHLLMANLLMDKGADKDVFRDASPHLLQHVRDPQLIESAMNAGFNAFQNVEKPSVVANMFARTPYATQMTNGEGWDFHRLAEEHPPILHTIVCPKQCSPHLLRAVIHRFPKDLRDSIVNPETLPHSNPGLKAALKDDPKFLHVMLDNGFDFNKECCSVGSALMFACKAGRLQSVKILVFRGARLAYVATDNHGEKIIRSAPHTAKFHPKIIRWLLVGRHQELKRLEATASHEAPLKPWSGIRRAAYLYHGQNGQFGRLNGESSLEFLERRCYVLRDLMGETVPAKLIDEEFV